MNQEIKIADKRGPKLTLTELRQSKLILLASTGMRVSEIAEKEGMSRQWVSEVLNREENQRLFNELYENSKQEIAERMPNILSVAMDYVEKQLTSTYTSDDRPAKLATATRLLDMMLKHSQPPLQPTQNTCKCTCCESR